MLLLGADECVCACVCVCKEWSTRVKQIAKLWRKASSQDRAPFVVSSMSLWGHDTKYFIYLFLFTCGLSISSCSKRLETIEQHNASTRCSCPTSPSSSATPPRRCRRPHQTLCHNSFSSIRRSHHS